MATTTLLKLASSNCDAKMGGRKGDKNKRTYNLATHKQGNGLGVINGERRPVLVRLEAVAFEAQHKCF